MTGIAPIVTLWIAGIFAAPVETRYLGCTAMVEDGNWAGYEQCLAATYRRHDPDGSGNRADVVEFWKHVKVAFPDLRLDPQLVVADHHDVYAVLLVTGTHEGTLHCHGDWPASHKPIRLFVIDRVTFDDTGHATDESFYFDANVVLAQIGVLEAAK